MSFLPIAHYTAFILSAGLIIFILAQNPRAAANRICAGLIASFAIWNFASAFFQATESKPIAMFWENVSAIGWCSYPPLALWLSLALTQKATRFKKWYFYPALIGFPVFFIGQQWTGALTFHLVKYPHWWAEVWEPSIGSWLFFVYLYSFTTVAIYLAVAFLKKTRLIAARKKGVRLVLAVTFIALILGTVTDVTLPLFQIHLIPPLSPMILLILAGGMAYAIAKYQFLILSPEYAAADILAAMNDALILIGPDGKLIDANTAAFQLLGYTREELQNQPIDILLASPEDSRAVAHQLQTQPAELNTFHDYSLLWRAKDGTPIPVRVSGSILRDPDDNLIGVVGVARDQREILRLQESEQAYEVEKARTEALEERARELQEAYDRLRTTQAKLIQSGKLAAVGQLAGGVAHEINNPLGVILGFAQSVVKRIPEDDPFYPPLKNIEREAIRCKKLVGDLLTFSRAGKSPAEIIDINTVIDDTLSLIEAQAKIKNVQITKDYGTGLPQISAHKNQLQQVIFNLCINAIDAMPKGGILTIATSCHDRSQLEITIHDTGHGMTEAVKQRLFEPFFTTKEIGKGTGLGLSLCAEIIQKHHGGIEVETELGKSSTFRIHLPIINR